jgi:hypothetical protein
MSRLTASERDALFRDCAIAIDSAGPDGDRAFLARLALLLMEALGDADRCRAAIAEAARDGARGGDDANGAASGDEAASGDGAG